MVHHRYAGVPAHSDRYGDRLHEGEVSRHKAGDAPVLRESDDDKVIVNRARRIRNFLSQPFHVAEGFSGFKGKYVPIKDTVRSFKAILDGKYDNYPESAFLYVGTIEDVEAKAGEQK